MLGIPRALWTLNRLQIRAGWRRFTRGLKTPRGALLTLFTGFILLLWMVPWIAARFFDDDVSRPENLHAWIVFSLFSLFVLQLLAPSKQFLAYTPAEVQFLFAGPFTRRQLLLFKLSRVFAFMITPAVFIALFAGRLAVSWPSAFLNLWLALCFFHLTTIALSIVAGIVEKRTYSRFRSAVLFGILVSLALFAWYFTPQMGEVDFEALWARVLESPWYQYGLAPFHVFAFGMNADALFPAGLFWAGAGVGLILVVALLILWLDADYREAAIAAGVKQYEQVQRIRRGGSVFSVKLSARRLFRVPSLPRWRGAGVILRRHLIALSRARSILLVFGIVAVLGLALGMVMRERGEDDQEILVFAPMGVAIYLAVFAGTALRADFRGEMSTMDQLKSLPLSSFAIGLGEVLAPTVVVTLALAVFGLFLGAFSGHFLAVAAVAIGLVPVNLALFAVDNFFFLLYPVQATTMSGNPQVIGLVTLIWMAKGLVVVIGLGIAVGAGGVLYWLLPSAALAVSVAWVVALGLALLGVVGVGWAFARFDPSRESPA